MHLIFIEFCVETQNQIPFGHVGMTQKYIKWMEMDAFLLKAISAASQVCAMSLNERQELVFSVHWSDTKIY